MLSSSTCSDCGALARWGRRLAVGVALVVGASAAAPALADVRPRPRDLKRHTKREPRARGEAAASAGEAATGAGEVEAGPGPSPEDPPEMIAPPQPEVAATTGVAVLPGPQAVGVQTELPEASADADAAELPATRPVDSGATSTVAALGLAVLALVVAGVALVARRRRR